MLEFAAAHSLSYDARSETVFGEYRGHPLILCFQDNDALSFVFSLKYKERMPGSALFNDLQNKCKSIHQIKQVRSQVIFVLRKALFGMKKAFATYIDETAQLFDTIFVSGGRLGMQMELAPDDLCQASGATYCDLTKA